MGTGYRPPSTEPRGRWAKHIHAKRREWGWSQTRGFEAVREGLGLSEKSRAAYITLDMGPRVPSPAEEQALAAVYGWPPEPATTGLESPESGDSTAAIVAAVERAIDRQTQAIVAAIQSRDATLEGLLSELGRYRADQLGVLRALTAPRAVPMPRDEAELDPPEPAAT